MNCRTQPHSYAFAFDQLPDGAQSLVCSLSSTPSCPGHVLLERVSTSWSAAAARLLEVDVASITLELSCSPSSCKKESQREAERLISLGAWILRCGKSLSSLVVKAPDLDEDSKQHVCGRALGVHAVMDALAIVAKRPGGLQLRQLGTPAVGGTPPSKIRAVLSACQQLRELHLGCTTHAPKTIHPSRYLNSSFSAVLQQLTQLTSLVMDVGFSVKPMPVSVVKLGGFFRRLPSSLEVLRVNFIRVGWPNPWFSIQTSSIQHLVALRQLALPVGMHVRASRTGKPLAALTALTLLEYNRAVTSGNYRLLALPNLVEIRTDYAELHFLPGLSSLTALRALECSVAQRDRHGGAVCLRRLTALTKLAVQFMEPASRLMPDKVAVWAQALSHLRDLGSLAVEPAMLEQLDINALASLTALEVTSGWHKSPYSNERLQQVLLGLAPARGRLRVVALRGLPASQLGLCRAAVAAALGPAEVEVLGLCWCDGGKWC